MSWYLQTCLTMMAAMLKFMFIQNQFIMQDDKSFWKCVCVLAATLTRSYINIEFVYLCIRSNNFSPISTISDYIHWAALVVWFFVFFITLMKSGMLEDLLHTYFVLFNIIRWNTTPHIIKDLILSWRKSHQSNQTRSTTWRTLIGCKDSSYFIPCTNLQYMYLYNLFRLRTIYTKYWNSTTK